MKKILRLTSINNGIRDVESILDTIQVWRDVYEFKMAVNDYGKKGVLHA